MTDNNTLLLTGWPQWSSSQHHHRSTPHVVIWTIHWPGPTRTKINPLIDQVPLIILQLMAFASTLLRQSIMMINATTRSSFPIRRLGSSNWVLDVYYIWDLASRKKLLFFLGLISQLKKQMAWTWAIWFKKLEEKEVSCLLTQERQLHWAGLFQFFFFFSGFSV